MAQEDWQPHPSAMGATELQKIRDKVGITQSTVSHYLDMMHKAGLVEPLRVGKWTYYRRNEETIRAFAAFVQEEL